MNFQQVNELLEGYRGRIQSVGDQLLRLREAYLIALSQLQTKEEEGRQMVVQLDLAVTKGKEFVKSYAFQEAQAESNAKLQLRAKEEEKDLLIEELNIVKTQVRLKELEFKLNL